MHEKLTNICHTKEVKACFTKKKQKIYSRISCHELKVEMPNLQQYEKIQYKMRFSTTLFNDFRIDTRITVKESTQTKKLKAN